ncbi:MAG: hypothetical protein R3B72_41995 [Polyangiaceae bacterium]
MELIDYASLAADEYAELAALVAGQPTLAEVARYAALAGRIEDVIAQDEYNLDVVVALASGRYLVYDTT